MLHRNQVAAILLTSLGLAACGDDDPGPVEGCDRQVAPSDDDQTTVQGMFEEALDGETLCFGAGTYSFEDPIEIRDLTGVTIRGATDDRADVILDFQNQTGGDNGLSAVGMTDITVANLTILDSRGNNLFIAGGDGVTIRNVRSGWDVRPMDARGKYALYPVTSTDVLVEDSEAFGSSDAGIYVGQATNCIVRNSVAVGNVAGIEIENSSNCEVHDNDAHENTGGILVFELPGLEQFGAGTSVHDNDVTDNNVANFAEVGTIVGELPAGTGIMVLSAEDVEIFDNTITGNGSAGILVASYQTLIDNDVVSDPEQPDYDTFINGVWLHDNTFSDNGGDPQGILAVVAGQGGVETLEDMVWDGAQGETPAANDFCVGGDGTFRNGNAPGGFTDQTTDPAPYDCSRTPRPPVTL